MKINVNIHVEIPNEGTNPSVRAVVTKNEKTVGVVERSYSLRNPAQLSALIADVSDEVENIIEKIYTQ